jgi:hypothetical protein
MPRLAPSRSPLRQFARLVRSWQGSLDGVSDESVARAIGFLEQALPTTEFYADFSDSWKPIQTFDGRLDEVKASIAKLSARLRSIEAEWLTTHRWTEAGLTSLRTTLQPLMKRKPVQAAQRWLHEVFDALRAQEQTAALQIANADLDFPDELRPGVEAIREGLAAWADQDMAGSLKFIETLAEGGPPPVGMGSPARSR